MALAVSEPDTARKLPSLLVETAERAGLLRISLDQYRRMIKAGIISEDDNVELLNGLIVRKDNGNSGKRNMGHDPIHRLIVAKLTRLAIKIDSKRRHLSIQLPIECPPDGVPEPDAAVVQGVPEDYKDRLPLGSETSCVIEAAYSSLLRDREEKLAIYASSGVRQYVLIDLVSNHVEVYTDPNPSSSQYQTKRTFAKGQKLPLQLPDGILEIDAAEILP